MRERDHNGKIILILLAFAVWGLYFYRDKYKEAVSNYEKLYDKLTLTESRLEDYQRALKEANSRIEDAQSYTWKKYEEMGQALDELYPVEP